MKSERAKKIKKLWKFFGTLDDCTRECVGNRIILEIEFNLFCEIESTKILFEEAGLTPNVCERKISCDTTLPIELLNEAGIHEDKI